MASHERIVREKYQQAQAVYHGPVVGADHPLDRDGHWAIYRSRELGTGRLGTGITESQAWEDAAAKVREEGSSSSA